MHRTNKIALFLTVLILQACQQGTTDKNHADTKTDSLAQQKAVSFADFKSIAGVDDVNKVPFMIYSTLDSVQFYSRADLQSPGQKVKNNGHMNYAFAAVGDFYVLHYSIDGVRDNSIEAFVLKSEFTLESELTLKGHDIAEIRSSNFKGVDNFDLKSFATYGTIEEVSERAFREAAAAKVQDPIQRNPKLQLQDTAWTLNTDNGHRFKILKEEPVAEEGMLRRTYIGGIASFQAEVFKEQTEHSTDIYYVFYDHQSSKQMHFSSGYPHVNAAPKVITSASINNDVGSNFAVERYTKDITEKNTLLYVNFTNFKVKDDGIAAFWSDERSFYMELYPLNAKPDSQGKQKTAFIKLQLNEKLW